jgi:prepilin-type processing-associated H-X9-DG protein
VVFVCLFLLAVVPVACRKSRFDSYRVLCSSHLSLIGKAMLDYSNDYDDQFPRSSGRNAMWKQAISSWKAPDRFRAYGLASDGGGGEGTISSCFYLLVKYQGVAPGTFVCPGDAGTTVFDPASAGAGDRELSDLWDFGPDAPNHCSYAYHMPFGLYALNTAFLPGMAVAADRNPWMNSPGAEAKEMALFMPDGGRAVIKIGNAVAHENEGQNVLFVDGHVAFEKESFCGVDKDNIYTWWDGGDIRRGGKPLPWAQPKGRTDSFLVNETPIYRATTTRQPEAVDSADLKQTAIAATLECPMPEHKNVIWCGTFQIAWDKFKDDIIGEHVQLTGAEDLADRLNRGEFSPKSMEEESFYATAGFVKDGIIGQIQKEMATRFPSEPKPTFDTRYGILPGASVAYCFLSIDVQFTFPFYVRERAFDFEASDGTRTGVTAFSSEPGGPDPNLGRLREQVEILYYRYGEQGRADEFAVDLCTHTNPYQIVLVCVSRREPLNEALWQIKQDISDFREDPYYESLRQLRPIDSLIVPDVFYKLTHHFKDLEGKDLGNPKWRAKGYFILEARQMIDFGLSRTGVVLKSEAVTGAAAGVAPPRIEQPRHLHFNRPFLIYVKKRGAEYSPFFVMWVDNAELMKQF